MTDQGNLHTTINEHKVCLLDYSNALRYSLHKFAYPTTSTARDLNIYGISLKRLGNARSCSLNNFQKPYIYISTLRSSPLVLREL